MYKPCCCFGRQQNDCYEAVLWKPDGILWLTVPIWDRSHAFCPVSQCGGVVGFLTSDFITDTAISQLWPAEANTHSLTRSYIHARSHRWLEYGCWNYMLQKAPLLSRGWRILTCVETWPAPLRSSQGETEDWTTFNTQSPPGTDRGQL